MIGPSDSFTHASQKLSEASREAIAGLQNIHVPPPAYTTNATVETDDSGSDIDDAENWKGQPVVVQINSSISIEGTGNQITVPSRPSSRALRDVGDGLRATQGSPLDYLGCPSAMDPNHLVDDRVRQITDAVMQELKDSGIFARTVTPMRQLDVHVDASITIKGERNIVTMSGSLRRNMSGTMAAEMPSPLPVPRGEGALEGSGIVSGDRSGRQPMEAVTLGEIQDQAQAPMLVDVTVQEDSTPDAGSGEEPENPSMKRKRTSSEDDGGWLQKRAKS